VGIRNLSFASIAFGLSVALAAICPNVVLAEVALVLVGASSIWFLATGNATLQLAAAPEMRGRVMALWTVAFIGTTPIGGPAIGWISENASPRWGLLVGAMAALIAALIGLLSVRRNAEALIPRG
jgi:MFS family permease